MNAFFEKYFRSDPLFGNMRTDEEKVISWQKTFDEMFAHSLNVLSAYDKCEQHINPLKFKRNTEGGKASKIDFFEIDYVTRMVVKV
jgi:hypothetical protein